METVPACLFPHMFRPPNINSIIRPRLHILTNGVHQGSITAEAGLNRHVLRTSRRFRQLPGFQSHAASTGLHRVHLGGERSWRSWVVGRAAPSCAVEVVTQPVNSKSLPSGRTW